MSPSTNVLSLTVVTRCHRRPTTLALCIESVRMQTDRDVEQVFIVDEVGRGLTWANRQLHEQRERVEGEYVFLLDDDGGILIESDFIARLKDCVERWDAPDVVLVRQRQLTGKKLLLPPPAVWSLDWEAGERPRRWVGSGYCFVVRRELWLANAWRYSYGQGEAWHTGGDWHFMTALCGWPGLNFVRFNVFVVLGALRGYGRIFEDCGPDWFTEIAEQFGIEDRGDGDWRLRHDGTG